MPRFELAVAASAAVPVSVVAGALKLTATVLKSAAVPTAVGELELAVKSAPEVASPEDGEDAERGKHGAAHVAASSVPSSRHRRARLAPAISSAGSAMTIMRTSRRLSPLSSVAGVGDRRCAPAPGSGWSSVNVQGSAIGFASPLVRKTRAPVASVSIETIRCVMRWSPAGGR